MTAAAAPAGAPPEDALPIGEDARARRRRLLAHLVAVGGAAAVNLALLAGAAPEASAPAAGPRLELASALLWLSVVPAWRYFHRGDRSIPFVPIIAIAYFFAYGLPAFTHEPQVTGSRVGTSAVTEAQVLALLGEATLLLGFYALPLRIVPRIRFPLDLRGHAARLLVLGWVALAARVALTRSTPPAALAQLAGVLASLPAVLGAGLALLAFRGQLRRLPAALAALLLAGALVLDFASGAIAQPIMTAVMLLFVYVAERQRLPVLAVGLAALVIVAGLGTKHEFRRRVAQRQGLDVADRVSLFGGLMWDVLARGAPGLEKARDVAESRIDHLSAFSRVVERTPATVPYWDGESYADFAWSFVPRFLYPEKPRKTLGQEYGHRYRFITQWDRRTSINLEQTVEMYANFVAPWVLLGMLFMGLLYRALYRMLNHPGAGDGGILVAATTFRTLLNIESDFSLVFGGIVQSALLLSLILYLSAGARAGPARAG